MLDPAEMLAVARSLAEHGVSMPSDAQLRRAISTAYYAVFHTVLQVAADRLVGPGERGSAAYALIYRGFTHVQMRRICEDVDRPTLPDKYKNSLKRNTIAPAIRDFAGSFLTLQRQRHAADYDPQALILQADVLDTCDAAEVTIRSLRAAPEPDLTEFLAVLLVNVRG